MNKLQIVSLITIIVICAFFSSIVWRQYDRFNRISPDSCTDAMIDRMRKEGNRNSDDKIQTDIRELTRIPIAKFLDDYKVKYDSLPVDVQRELKDIVTYDVLDQFKRHIVFNQDNQEIETDQCVIPVSLMRRFKDQVRNNSVDIINSNQFENSVYKKCKIDNYFFPSNIKNSLSNDFNQLMNMDSAKEDRIKYYGCLFPNKNLDQVMLDQLKTMYKYSDTDLMRRLTEIIIQYTTSVDVLNEAKNRNRIANERRALSEQQLKSSQEQERISNANKVAQETARDQNAAAASSAFVVKTSAENSALTEITKRK